jgi:nucleoid-associated protein YgaU
MKKTLKFSIAIGLVLALGACSSSQTAENGESADPSAAPATDAATDAIPQPDPEAAAMAQADPLSPPPADQPLPDAPPPANADLAAAEASPAAPPADAMQAPPPATTPEPAPVVAQADPAAVEPTPSGSGSFENYNVQVGDTLMKIAFETYGDLYRWKSILDANKDKVSDPSRIPAGTVLKLEKPSIPVTVSKNGDKYMIKTGDTLGTISNDVYGTRSKWKVLWENNKQLIHDPNRIFAGFYLYYQPDATVKQQPMADAAPAKAVETARAPAAAAPAMTPQAVDAPPAMVPATPGPDVGAAPGAPANGG